MPAKLLYAGRNSRMAVYPRGAFTSPSATALDSNVNRDFQGGLTASSKHDHDRSCLHSKEAHIARLLKWLAAHQLGLLLLFAVVVGGIWGFVEIADEVMEGETHAIDERLLLALRNPTDPTDPLGPAWMEELGRDFSALGGVGVLTLLTAAAVGYTLLLGRKRMATFILAAVCGGLLLSITLKYGFERPRPELVPHGSYVYTASFPSGHSMMSAIAYLTLGALLARLQPRLRLKVYILSCMALVTLLVGLSRVYLGVHWPSDVLAGWLIGATWALFCWLVARVLQLRGQLETGPLP